MSGAQRNKETLSSVIQNKGPEWQFPLWLIPSVCAFYLAVCPAGDAGPSGTMSNKSSQQSGRRVVWLHQDVAALLPPRWDRLGVPWLFDGACWKGAKCNLGFDHSTDNLYIPSMLLRRTSNSWRFLRHSVGVWSTSFSRCNHTLNNRDLNETKGQDYVAVISHQEENALFICGLTSSCAGPMAACCSLSQILCGGLLPHRQLQKMKLPA